MEQMLVLGRHADLIFESICSGLSYSISDKCLHSCRETYTQHNFIFIQMCITIHIAVQNKTNGTSADSGYERCITKANIRNPHKDYKETFTTVFVQWWTGKILECSIAPILK